MQGRVLLGILALGVASLVLYAQHAFSSGSGAAADDISDGAKLLRDVRRRAEDRWQQRPRGHVGDAASHGPAEVAGGAASASSVAAVGGPPATSAASRAAAGCESSEPRPYHTVLTSSSGGYQTWQCRIMYHHWKLQKRMDPCGEMGGFTRLLTNQRGEDDGRSHSHEIPTVVVKELSGMEARGYVVANRPYSMLQFVSHPEFAARIVEDYVYIAETDHILLRPLPNLATAEVPAAFNFGYMVAWGQANIVNKFVPGLGGKTDPVGPSPVIIHKSQLLKIAKPWYELTLKICADGEAVQALGWVREMWGWCIAAGQLGIKHRVLEAFQYEGGSIGNRERPLAWPVPPTPVTPDRAEMPYYIFHYTYGIEYSVEGLPMELQVGEWSLDKRHYMGGGPPRQLLAPPACAHDRAHVLRALYNNASATLEWGGGANGQADRFNNLAFRGHDLRGHTTAAKLLGTGPWVLAGRMGGRSFRLEKMWILNNGWMVSQKGHGRWGVNGASDPYLTFATCGQKLRLKLVIAPADATEGAGGWSLVTDGGETMATLSVPADVLALWSTAPRAPADELAARVEGSGPYRGTRAGSIYLLRAGVMQAYGSAYHRYTRWRTHGDGHTLSLSTPAGDTGGELVAHFSDCWIIRFPAASASSMLHGLLSGGGAGGNLSAAAPPRYGTGIAADQAEWIVQPAASLCEDVCAGLTLRKLNAEDRAKSAAARSLEECGCGFTWAGFGGLQFLPGGELKTPWGRGVWGAPPEAQGGKQISLLAEFAGFKHLLSATLETRPGGKVRLGARLQSRRCNDNDPAHIGLASGTTLDV